MAHASMFSIISFLAAVGQRRTCGRCHVSQTLTVFQFEDFRFARYVIDKEPTSWDGIDLGASMLASRRVDLPIRDRHCCAFASILFTLREQD